MNFTKTTVRTIRTAAAGAIFVNGVRVRTSCDPTELQAIAERLAAALGVDHELRVLTPTVLCGTWETEYRREFSVTRNDPVSAMH